MLNLVDTRADNVAIPMHVRAMWQPLANRKSKEKRVVNENNGRMAWVAEVNAIREHQDKQAFASLESDPSVVFLQKRFEAELDRDSVRPI
mgnify:CR=1 FL=1